MSGILLASVGNSYGSLPVNTVAPAITGTAEIGNTLTTSDGTWTGAPAPTFTYQWQRGTTNIAGATSSTYTVQLEDEGSTIRCVVTATNSLGSVSANSASTSTIPDVALGDAVGGGFYGGKINDGGTEYYLIVAPKASGENSSKQWKTSNTGTSGTTSTIDGPSNTSAMISAGAAAHPAADFCDDLSIGGFTDWYMPAKDELEVLYYNLKPSVESNDISSGTNTNAVPPRNSNYTSGNPAQTSVTDFQAGNTEPFVTTLYWSSTEFSSAFAFFQNFGSGRQSDNDVDNSFYVRAVRRVAV